MRSLAFASFILATLAPAATLELHRLGVLGSNPTVSFCAWPPRYLENVRSNQGRSRSKTLVLSRTYLHSAAYGRNQRGGHRGTETQRNQRAKTREIDFVGPGHCR